MRHNRSGRVGLVEVLVAMFAIGLLVSLLLPLMQANRDGGPGYGCKTNLRMCWLALEQVEERQRQYPGYANVVGGKRASWVVLLLPYFERHDLYRNWEQETATFESPDVGRYDAKMIWPIDVLICPAAFDPGSRVADPLSYVVNSGSARTANDFHPDLSGVRAWMEDRASGVFFNRARADFSKSIRQPSPRPPVDAFSAESGPTMTADYIAEHDGANYTIMLTENLQAGGWGCDPAAPGQPMRSEFQLRQATSAVWLITGQRDNQLPISATVSSERAFDPSLLGINRRRGLSQPLAESFSFESSSNSGGLAAARPSSNHPGGVYVLFCGGNAQYLSEEIDYRVFTQLMTPNGREVVVDIDANGEPIRADAPAGSSPRVVTPWTYDLDESEF